LRAPQAQSAQRVQQVRQVHPVLEDRPAPLDRNPREILKGSMAERGQLTVISSDRVDRGVGNLGSPVMQAEVECWLDGVVCMSYCFACSTAAIF
jgi:hypothetical protein